MNIPELMKEFKGRIAKVPEEYIIVAILVLVALTAFGLGRLSAIGDVQSEPVRILKPQDQGAQVMGATMPIIPVEKASGDRGKKTNNLMAEGEVVASKNGTKYHLPWCSGAKRISEANRVTFKSAAEAERAGYSPAANCPGL